MPCFSEEHSPTFVIKLKWKDKVLRGKSPMICEISVGGNAIFAMLHQNTKNLWRGNLHVDELLDLPMFSYKNLSLEEMYEGGSYQNNLKWSEELHHKLSQHSNPTPRTALGL